MTCVCFVLFPAVGTVQRAMTCRGGCGPVPCRWVWMGGRGRWLMPDPGLGGSAGLAMRRASCARSDLYEHMEPASGAVHHALQVLLGITGLCFFLGLPFFFFACMCTPTGRSRIIIRVAHFHSGPHPLVAWVAHADVCPHVAGAAGARLRRCLRMLRLRRVNWTTVWLASSGVRTRPGGAAEPCPSENRRSGAHFT